MGYAYRCSKCRTRNTFARRLEDYIRTKVCKSCGHKRFYWDKERNKRRDYCTCEGYHFKHRIRSLFCVHNPNYELNVRVLRYGEEPEEVMLDIAWNNSSPCTSEEPPF
jgi:Zn ribbon nucleic-acid-binding protein